jgi:hypothetical protein
VRTLSGRFTPVKRETMASLRQALPATSPRWILKKRGSRRGQPPRSVTWRASDRPCSVGAETNGRGAPVPWDSLPSGASALLLAKAEGARG